MRLVLSLMLAAASCASLDASAAEIYAGAGTTGIELGLAQPLGERFTLRLDANRLDFTRKFTSGQVQYDARLKASNAGVYVDWFALGSFRFTGGALVGSREIHGTARSVGNTVKVGGTVYPLVAGDALDFDAKYPKASPYVGLGWGHQAGGSGLQWYADAGVAFGRADVTLTPVGSLVSRITAADLAAERSAAQDGSSGLRYYPVIKLGLRYAF